MQHFLQPPIPRSYYLFSVCVFPVPTAPDNLHVSTCAELSARFGSLRVAGSQNYRRGNMQDG